MGRNLWIVIACGGVILALAVGLRQTFGLFLPPISSDLGGGRESFALAVGLMNLVWGLAAPFSGDVADRFGAGRVAATGGFLYAGGLAATAPRSHGVHLVLGGMLIGLGLACEIGRAHV